MYNKLNEERWETLLSAAVIQNSLNELERYPSDDELNKIVIPLKYDNRMRSIIKKATQKRKAVKVITLFRQMASAIIIIFGISFLFLLQFEEVRAACSSVVIQIYEKYTEFSYRTSERTGSSMQLEMGYIPEGFYEVENTSDEIKVSLKYKNDEGDFFSLLYSPEAKIFQFDNEQYETFDLIINGEEGKFFTSDNVLFNNYLVWYKDTGRYTLKSTLNRDEMIKIAEKIK